MTYPIGTILIPAMPSVKSRYMFSIVVDTHPMTTSSKTYTYYIVKSMHHDGSISDSNYEESYLTDLYHVIK